MSSALISSADASRIAIPAEDEDVAALRQSVVTKLTYAVGRDPIVATDRDWFMATALAVRDRVVDAGWPRPAPTTRRASGSITCRSSS